MRGSGCPIDEGGYLTSGSFDGDDSGADLDLDVLWDLQELVREDVPHLGRLVGRYLGLRGLRVSTTAICVCGSDFLRLWVASAKLRVANDTCVCLGTWLVINLKMMTFSSQFHIYHYVCFSNFFSSDLQVWQTSRCYLPLQIENTSGCKAGNLCRLIRNPQAGAARNLAPSTVSPRIASISRILL
jgi:hypothetical protein